MEKKISLRAGDVFLILPHALHMVKKGTGKIARYRTVIFDPVLLYGYKGSYFYEKYYRTFAAAQPFYHFADTGNPGSGRQRRIWKACLPGSKRFRNIGSCVYVRICSGYGCLYVKICPTAAGKLTAANRSSSGQQCSLIFCMNITGRNSHWISLRLLRISAKGSAAGFLKDGTYDTMGVSAGIPALTEHGALG
ncbi:MAG: hypothetical protein ACLRMZ_04490 [Blautia marasmi]